MKLRLLISFLFIIATTVTAIHELEHIGHEHDSSTCQVCIVDNHSVSADIIDDFTEIEIVKFSEISSTLLVKLTHTKDHSYQTRAPPFNS
ncbi:hypothetical protein M947_07970 [Sulfurimonas hongkongensis]|uniref:Uncharacterized protein n=1 Tax=Sulfurimonas hongkongensis TaxID=1172190 RepID=T0KZT1_9BACT|nr:hypothetical protein [Sulfurimonas hongkongensis]EQB39088.1 hypothetical protein M947_07970 [Sulfurimonas hongkongensis]